MNKQDFNLLGRMTGWKKRDIVSDSQKCGTSTMVFHL
jgi:hypothetical protein